MAAGASPLSSLQRERRYAGRAAALRVHGRCDSRDTSHLVLVILCRAALALAAPALGSCLLDGAAPSAWQRGRGVEEDVWPLRGRRRPPTCARRDGHRLPPRPLPLERRRAQLLPWQGQQRLAWRHGPRRCAMREQRRQGRGWATTLTSEVLETYRAIARRENFDIIIRGKTKVWAMEPPASRRDSAELFASSSSYTKSTASSLHGTSVPRWSARPKTEAGVKAATHDA